MRNYKYYREHPWMNHYVLAKARCNNPNLTSYKRYGAKGIKFLMTNEDFEYLWNRDKAWLLKQPSIDRKNSKWNYVRKNCRFIELVKNSQEGKRKLTNRQILNIRNKYIKRIFPYSFWAKKYNVHFTLIGQIIRREIWKDI